MWTIQNRKLIRGAKEHIAAGLGAGADYVADYEDIASPIDGIVEKRYMGNQGGKWLLIKDNQGKSWQFAHLSIYKCSKNDKIKQGQIIAVSGNSGQITSGPHLHIQVIDKNEERLDPEIIIKELLQPIMPNYENKIIRNAANGEYSFVLKGVRRTITEARAGLCAITAIDRGLTKDDIITIPEAEYNKIPKGTNF